MTHGNTIHKTKYVPCQGLTQAGLLSCPPRHRWIDLEECLAHAAKHGYSHVAVIENEACVMLHVIKDES